jgi:hypothetical protein
VLGKIPTIHRLDQDPTAVIRSGDFVRVDADLGIVEICRVAGG